MYPMTLQHRAELLDSILHVAMSCPVDLTNPVDCPLFLMRQLDLPERIQWFNALTDDDLAYLASYHCVCMKNKMETLSAELCH